MRTSSNQRITCTGEPGAYARRLAQQRQTDGAKRITLGIVAMILSGAGCSIAFLLATAWPVAAALTILIGTVLATIGIALAFAGLSSLSASRNAMIGAVAEEQVARFLDAHAQRHGWTVIHDATAPYGNIDHIVLRSDGLAALIIETKAYRRATMRDPRMQRAHQSVRAASRYVATIAPGMRCIPVVALPLAIGSAYARDGVHIIVGCDQAAMTALVRIIGAGAVPNPERTARIVRVIRSGSVSAAPADGHAQRMP